MKIFVFDTETTWFINKKEPDLDKQPHIIQFAGIMWDLSDGEFKEEKRINILINPWSPIPYASSQVHHLYDIDVKDAKKIDEVIDEILYCINTPDIIVWHNIEYDENMVKLELNRLSRVHDYKPKQIICTMNWSTNFCKLPKKNEFAFWFKRPKLWELHKILFDSYFIWAHDALADVEATLRSYVELVNRWVLKVEKKEENIMSLF
jgi:DNA polymerase III epsilon subunit-like protein